MVVTTWDIGLEYDLYVFKIFYENAELFENKIVSLNSC
jgi:hypothetical protein